MPIHSFLARCRPLAQVASLSLLLFPVLLGARGCEYGVACPAVYDPVCGEDGTTYSNECEAHRADVGVLHEGACGCLYTAETAPVCGVDGVTYPNESWAVCDGVPIAHEGPCGGACACPDIYAPVCGADGVTYGNGCEASCVGVPVARDGACGCGDVFCTLHCEFGFVLDPATGCPTCTCNPEPSCVCPEYYAPVCGVDGQRYDNACFAACAGVDIAPDEVCGGWACAAVYEPVCGEDGVTYGNACEAARLGVAVAREGACECAPVLCDLACDGGFARDVMTGCEICACAPILPAGCTSDADCGPGGSCLPTPCAGPDDSSMPFSCPSYCVYDHEPIHCTSDAECPAGLVCDVPSFDCPPEALCAESLGLCVDPATVPAI